MDMNFPHTDLNRTDLKPAAQNNACDIRALLSHAMSRQINSPTYKALSQLAERSPAKPKGEVDVVRDHIHYFIGKGKTAPNASFLLPGQHGRGGCAKAEHIGELPVYHAASANGKQVDVHTNHARPWNANNRGQA